MRSRPTEVSSKTRPPVQGASTSRESTAGLTHSSIFSVSNLDEFPTLGAVSSQRSNTNTTRNTTTTTSVWTARMNASGKSLNQVLPSVKPTILPPQMAEVKTLSNSQSPNVDRVAINNSPSCTRPGVFAPVLPSAKPANMTSQMAKTGVVSSQRCNADISKNIATFARSARPQSSGISTPALPLDNSTTMTSQIPQDRTAPSTKTVAKQSSNSASDPRKIPEGVFVVCDDFLQKNLKRAASIYEKTKACKGCENRSKLKYAVWSDNSKQWEIIRPYPAEKVPPNVAFAECRQYVSNIPCLRTPCSFAHGQQELLMWTLEREGG